MPVNAEKEITKLWRTLHAAQGELCKTYYRWREVALEFAGPDTKPVDVALKAAEMMGDFGELEAIETLRSRKFGNEKIQAQVNDAVKKIHERFFTRECPFCAEIIKARAVVCKHCGKDLAKAD